MKPLTPETDDLRFRQKIGTLRSELTGRQRQYRRKKQVGLGLTVLGLLLVLAVGRYYWTANTVSNELPAQRLDSPLRASEEPMPAAGGGQAALKVVTGLPASLSLEAPFPAPLPEVESTAPEVPEPVHETLVRVAATEEPVAAENISASVPSGESEGAIQEPFADDSAGLASAKPMSAAGSDQAALEVVAGLPASLSPEVQSAAPEVSIPAETAVRVTVTEDSVAEERISALLPAADSDVAKREPSPLVTTLAEPIRVAKTLTCVGIDARQCVGVQSVFSLAEHPQPHVWMTVFSDTLPYVLKHVYYHDGEKYCEVALNIAYPRTRTWSNVTLQDPQHVGDWRVEVVTPDGIVLEQIAFQVVP